MAPALAQRFTVVCTDLRGYGDSEKPPGGDDHSGYSFRAMAQDQVEVMAALGFPRFMAGRRCCLSGRFLLNPYRRSGRNHATRSLRPRHAPAQPRIPCRS